MKRTLAITILAASIFLGFRADSAEACAVAALGYMATQADVQCWADADHSRCAGAITPQQCTAFQNQAVSMNLLTAGALLWLQQNLYCPIVVPGMNEILSVCAQGCFAADTEFLTDVAADGKFGWTSASTLASTMTSTSLAPGAKLMSMSDEANLHAVSLTPRSVERFVSGPEVAPLFVFKLSSGSTLRVTQHHPMVLHNGKVIEAAQVDRHMAFMGTDGRRVEITSITREKTADDVFNFETGGETQLSHVIVAEGVLVGDLKLQNELEFEQNSIKLRR